MRKKFIASKIGYDEKNKEEIAPVMKYMIGHLIFCNCWIALSYFLILNYYVHTAFCGVIFCVATWHGATRYYNMMTKYTIKKIEKLLSL